jgi:hypothetical protein
MGEAWSKAAIVAVKISDSRKWRILYELPGNQSKMPHIACLPPGKRDPHAMAS